MSRSNRKPAGRTLQPAKNKTNFDTVGNVRVKALVNTLFETVPEAKATNSLDTI